MACCRLAGTMPASRGFVVQTPSFMLLVQASSTAESTAHGSRRCCLDLHCCHAVTLPHLKTTRSINDEYINTGQNASQMIIGDPAPTPCNAIEPPSSRRRRPSPLAGLQDGKSSRRLIKQARRCDRRPPSAAPPRRPCRSAGQSRRRARRRFGPGRPAPRSAGRPLPCASCPAP